MLASLCGVLRAIIQAGGLRSLTEPTVPLGAGKGKAIKRNPRDFQRLTGPVIDDSELPTPPPPADLEGGGHALGGYCAVTPRFPSVMLLSRCFASKKPADVIAWLITGRPPNRVRRELETCGYVLISAMPVTLRDQLKTPMTGGGTMTQPLWPEPGGTLFRDPDNPELSDFRPRSRASDSGPLALFVAYGQAGGLFTPGAATTLGEIGTSRLLLQAGSHAMTYYHPQVGEHIIRVNGNALDWGPLQTTVGDGKQVSLRTADGVRAELCGCFLSTGLLTGDLVTVPVDLGYPVLPCLRAVSLGAVLAESPAGPWIIERLLNKVHNDLDEYAHRGRPGGEDDVDTCLQDRVPEYFPRVPAAGVVVKLSKLRAAVQLVTLRPSTYTSFATFAKAVDAALSLIDEFHSRTWYRGGVDIGRDEFATLLSSVKTGAGAAATARAHKEAEELAAAARARDPKAVAKVERILAAPRHARFKDIRAERRARAIERAADVVDASMIPQMHTWARKTSRGLSGSGAAHAGAGAAASAGPVAETTVPDPPVQLRDPKVSDSISASDAQRLLEVANRDRSPTEGDAGTLIALINSAIGGVSGALGSLGSLIKGAFASFVGRMSELKIAIRDALTEWSAQPTYVPLTAEEGRWQYHFRNCTLSVGGNRSGPYRGVGKETTNHTVLLNTAWGSSRTEVPGNIDLDMPPGWVIFWHRRGPIPAGIAEASDAVRMQAGAMKDLIMLSSVLGAVGKIMSVLRACYIYIAQSLGLPAPRAPKVILGELRFKTDILNSYVCASKTYDEFAEETFNQLESIYSEAVHSDLTSHPEARAAMHALTMCVRARSRFLEELGTRKPEVVNLLIHGRPGTGKDSAASLIATALCNHYRDAKGRASRTYIMQDSTEWMDFWNAALVLIIQDFLATADPDLRKASVSRFLNISSGALARTEAAEADQKGKLIEHAFGIFTTNESHKRSDIPIPLRCPDAFWRRVSLQVAMAPTSTPANPRFVLLRLGPNCGFDTIGTDLSPGTDELSIDQLVALLVAIRTYKLRVTTALNTMTVPTDSTLPSFLRPNSRLLSSLAPADDLGAGAGAGTGTSASPLLPPDPGPLSLAAAAAAAAPASAAAVTAQSTACTILGVLGGLLVALMAYAFAEGLFESPIALAERAIKRSVAAMAIDGVAGVVGYLTAVISYVVRFAAVAASRVFTFIWENSLGLARLGYLALVVGLIWSFWRDDGKPKPQAAGAVAAYDSTARRVRQYKVLPYTFKFTVRTTTRAQATRSAVEGVLRKITNNTVELEVLVDGAEPRSVCGTFLRPGEFISVAHAFIGPRGNKDAETGLGIDGQMSFVHNHKRYTYNLSDVEIRRSAGLSNDLILVRVSGGPNGINDITSHMLSALAYGGTSSAKLVGNPSDLALGQAVLGEATAYEIAVDGVEHVFRTATPIAYAGGITQDGMCGRLVVDSLTGDILGMHVASSSTRGCAIPLPAEAFTERPQSRNNPISDGPVRPLSDFVGGHHDSYGGPPGFVPMPEMDELRAFAASSGWPVKAPSKVLHPRGTIGVWDVFQNGPPMPGALAGVDQTTIDLAATLVFPDGHYPPLSFDEALALCDPTKSPGLPYTAMGVHHKSELMEGAGAERLLEDVRTLSYCVQDPEFGPLVSVKVKDELIKPGKMARVIAAMPMDTHVLLVSGFYNLQQGTMAARDVLRVAKGINPMSQEWTALRDRMARHPIIACFDVKKIDQSISRDFIDEFARCAYLRLGPGAPEFYRDAVRALARGWWVFDATCYRADGMNPSGNYLTVEINDFVMNTVFLLALSRVTGLKPPEVVHRFDWVTFGDDSLVGIDATVDQCALIEAAREWGLVLTHADKLPHGPDYVTPRAEVTFLKRYLFHEHDGIHVPRIEPTTIISSVAHRKRTDTRGHYYSQRANSALCEASLWGRDMYTVVRGSVEGSMAALRWQYTPTGVPEPIPSYEDMWAKMRAVILEEPGTSTYTPLL